MHRTLRGRYDLVSELGRGGMAVVWRAHDRRLDRAVAVKLIHPWLAQDADVRRWFAREARALGRLTHPNVIAVYDFDDSADEAYLVMELIDGPSLADHVAGRLPLSFDEATELLRPVSEGLAFAHARGVVHRDLRPSNVLLDSSGRTVVSDFGLARIAENIPTITLTSVLVGSPEYWAPEQAAGEPVTPAADVYALGCVLYYLTTGHLPFEGEDRLALGYRRVQEPPVDPRRWIPDLRAESAALILALLDRRPGRRPTAATAFPRPDSAQSHRRRPEPPVLSATDWATIPKPPQEATLVTRRTPVPRNRVRVRVLVAAATLVACGTAAGISSDAIQREAVATGAGSVPAPRTHELGSRLLVPAEPGYAGSARLTALLVDDQALVHAPPLGVSVTDAQVARRLREVKARLFGGSELRYRAELRRERTTDRQMRGRIRAELVAAALARRLASTVAVTDRDVRGYRASHPGTDPAVAAGRLLARARAVALADWLDVLRSRS